MAVTDHAGTDEARPRYGPFAIATVTASLFAWPIAFNLGAYGEVFYEDIFNFVVLGMAGLAVSFLTPAQEGSRLWATRVALAAPALWFLLAVVLFDSTAEAATDPVFGLVGLVVALVSVPAVFFLVVELFLPEASALDSLRLVVAAVLVVALIAVAAYAVGRNNDRFLQCRDFKVAGADQPTNCSPP